MIIDFKEQQIGNYIIPAFTLSAREIVVVRLPEGQAFFDLTIALNAFFSKTMQTQTTIITKPLVYVTHFYKYNKILGMLFPMTVGKWFRKNANKFNPVYKDIYNEIKWVTPETKINHLGGDNRRLLSLYTTLSHTNNIILDLVGVGPEGAIKIYALLKKIATDGGAIILYDRCDEFKNDCTYYIETKSITDTPQPYSKTKIHIS